MNILQITNYECASMSANDNTGINRVVTALSSYFVHTAGYTCYNAYFNANPKGLSEVFSAGLQLALPLNEDEFRSFLIVNQIDRIVINVFKTEHIRILPQINQIAHQCQAKTTYCIHFMPGYEAYAHTDSPLLYYNLFHKIKVVDTFKKWIINISRPLSSELILKVIKKRYLLPLEATDKVVVFSESYIQQYLDIARSRHSEKMVAIPNPLPFSSFMSKDELVNKKKTVIIVGRLYEPQKRLSYALRVWKMIEKNPNLIDWKLIVVGAGDSEGYYKWLIEKYHLKNVVLTGPQDPKPYYKEASILISSSAFEGWPMVIMEGMPIGVIPCVFNSYGATRDIIDHNENGIIAPDNNIKAMYESLADLMLNPDKRLQMATATIEKSKSFDMAIIGERWRKDALQALPD